LSRLPFDRQFLTARTAFDHQNFFPRIFGDQIEFIQIGFDHSLDIGDFIP